jgi:hypothetical protein
MISDNLSSSFSSSSVFGKFESPFEMIHSSLASLFVGFCQVCFTLPTVSIGSSSEKRGIISHGCPPVMMPDRVTMWNGNAARYTENVVSSSWKQTTPSPTLNLPKSRPDEQPPNKRRRNKESQQPAPATENGRPTNGLRQAGIS